jgi:hypothetical protein
MSEIISGALTLAGLLLMACLMVWLFAPEFVVVMWAYREVRKAAAMLPESDRERYIKEQHEGISRGISSKSTHPKEAG